MNRVSKAAALAAALGVVGLSAGGCGNYSNDDLEYLNAMPQTEDVSMEAPLMASVRRLEEDEALKMTTAVTTVVNATAAALLGLVDKIRTYTPTSRSANGRVWGPFPDDNHPGWQVAFRMSKATAADGVTSHFDYQLVMIGPPGTTFVGPAGTTNETAVLVGWFEWAGRASGGTGHLVLQPKEARDAGLLLENLDKVITFTVDYDNLSDVRMLNVSVVNEPPVDPTKDAQSATYHYERAPNGDGAMQFTFLQDTVEGPAGVDTLDIKSRWRMTGEGRARISVLSGDHAGLTWVDCWAASSLTSYNELRSVGDPATCISEL